MPSSPFDWIQSIHNLVSKTERSSGFRPFLIFISIVLSFVVVLLFWFSHIPTIIVLVLWMVKAVVIAFIVLFAIKAIVDPNFCRSESHVQRLMKIEREVMGSETKQVKAEIIEHELLTKSGPEPSVRVISHDAESQ